jgi:hypothetical protein
MLITYSAIVNDAPYYANPDPVDLIVLRRQYTYTFNKYSSSKSPQDTDIVADCVKNYNIKYIFLSNEAVLSPALNARGVDSKSVERMCNL